MKISSCTTALEKALQPELASPPTLEQDIGLATLLHTLTLHLKETLHTLEEHSDQIAEDIFHFGFLWEYIAKLYPHTSDICHEIIQRRHELYAQKNSLKDYIENYSDIEFSQTAQAILQSGQLEPALEGAGAAYFLIDTLGNPRYVIKPIDEDIFCLNNRKQFGSPLADPLIRVRNFIPLYRSAQTDVLAYRVACHLGIESVTPKTEIMIIDSDAFFDITQRLSEQDSHKYLSCLEVSDKEKVCSVQEYVHGSVMMQQLIYSWLREGLSEEEISSKLCPEDFEKANLLIWTSFDTDAHLGNFVLYPKEEGLYGIKKVDNGLSFPEDNAELRNFLTFFSQAKTPLSSDLKEKIKAIPKEAILSDMHLLSLSEQAKQAFVRRTDTIQSLAEKEGMTIYEMNLRLMLLGKEEGDVDALKQMSIEELESLVGLQTSTTKETSAK